MFVICRVHKWRRRSACLTAMLFFVIAQSISVFAQPLKPEAATNETAKAASTVNLVYDAAEADIYFIEMRVDQATDNSSFVACGWENGYFGLQQYNGKDKRAFNFSAWNAQPDPAEPTVPDDPVEVLYSHPHTVVKHLAGKGGTVQCMREFHWRVSATYRFAIQAQVQTNRTAYTAWLFDTSSNKWERIATFRALSGRWLRGYYSFIEDFRRDFKSATETRRARFGNIWIHQNGGTYNPCRQAMFTISTLRTEARSAINAGESDGEFFLATGGNVHKTQKVGGTIFLTNKVPFRKPEYPELPFLYNPPKL